MVRTGSGSARGGCCRKKAKEEYINRQELIPAVKVLMVFHCFPFVYLEIFIVYFSLTLTYPYII
jgi:hypothetical protein